MHSPIKRNGSARPSCFLAMFTKGNKLCYSFSSLKKKAFPTRYLHLTLLHSELQKLHRVLAVPSAVGLEKEFFPRVANSFLLELTPIDESGRK